MRILSAALPECFMLVNKYVTLKDAEDGVARKEETGKAKKEVYGCGERGHG